MSSSASSSAAGASGASNSKSVAELASLVGASNSAYANGLTAEQLAQFDRDGYLVLPDFFSLEVARGLKGHIDNLVAGLDLSTHPRTIFRTSAGGEQTGNAATDAPVEDKNSSVTAQAELRALDCRSSRAEVSSRLC